MGYQPIFFFDSKTRAGSPCRLLNLLANGTEVSRSAAEHNSFDLAFAYATGFASAGIDAMQLLKRAGIALGIPIIAQRTAAMSQGASEGVFDRAIQPRDLLIGETICRDKRMNSSGE